MEHLPQNINRSVFKNAVSQIGGRLLLSVARLVLAAMIVRYAGVAGFGEYSLVLSLLLIGEWLVDFGLTEISVRNICQQPAQEATMLRTLTQARLFQGTLAFAILMLVVHLLDYSSTIARGAEIGGISLLFYAGVLVYRTLFRVRMQMERDVFSEVAGVLLTLPLVWYVCKGGVAVETLVACYLASRLAFLLFALLLGRRSFKLSIAGVQGKDVIQVFKETLPLGIAGLLVCVYDNLAPIMLAHLANTQAVGYYSSAIRFVFPIIVVIQSINGAFYPLLSAYWQKPGTAFVDTQQAAVDGSILISAALFCTLNSGAEWLMALIAPDMQPASDILRLLSWVIIVRAISTTMSPLIIITGAQSKMLWLAVLSLVCQFFALRWAIPLYGAWGAAMTYLVSELAISLWPIVLISQHLAKVRLRWRITLLALLSAVLALQACQWLQLQGIQAAVFTFFTYALLSIVLGAVSVKKLRRITNSLRPQAAEPGVS
jgi:O-antigen/teichoic acid export membrane protein